MKFSQRTPHVLLALMDMVQNARNPVDLDYVYNLTITFLQYGADPNINFPSTEPIFVQSQSSVYIKKSSNQVLYYFLQLILRKEDFLNDPEQRFARIIWIYYLAMDHKGLYSCLKILYSTTGLVPTGHSLNTFIHDLYANPRSLKQSCRVAIYRSLGRRTAQNISKLPLPTVLKEYILNWEP